MQIRIQVTEYRPGEFRATATVRTPRGKTKTLTAVSSFGRADVIERICAQAEAALWEPRVEFVDIEV